MLYYLLCVAGNFLPASQIHSTSLLFRLRWRINRIYLAGVARCTFPDSGNPVLKFLYISRCGQAWGIGRLQYFRSIRVPVRPDRLHVQVFLKTLGYACFLRNTGNAFGHVHDPATLFNAKTAQGEECFTSLRCNPVGITSACIQHDVRHFLHTFICHFNQTLLLSLKYSIMYEFSFLVD